MRKWTKGAKWDLMIRFEDGASYRLSSIPEKKHTNAAMMKSITENFLPVLKSIEDHIASASSQQEKP